MAVIEILGHATTNEIIKTVKERFPEIGVATIYRNLENLEEIGLIRKLSTNLKENIYESTKYEDHDHFICSDCGKIIDVKKNDTLKNNFDEEGNLVNDTSVTYYGICKDCIKNKMS